MPNYRRSNVAGGTYFITQVTYQREPWLCTKIVRNALREAIKKVQQKYYFLIDAFILLPEHFHCLWTLPPNNSDLSLRLRLIKSYVTKHYKKQLGINSPISQSRQKQGESNLWQRRFWEHLIVDEDDFANHCNYIHYNPVKHNLCSYPQQWEFSTISRFINQGIYPPNWGMNQAPKIPHNVCGE